MVALGQGINGTFPNLAIVDIRDAVNYAAGHLLNALDSHYDDDFDFTNRTSI